MGILRYDPFFFRQEFGDLCRNIFSLQGSRERHSRMAGQSRVTCRKNFGNAERRRTDAKPDRQRPLSMAVCMIPYQMSFGSCQNIHKKYISKHLKMLRHSLKLHTISIAFPEQAQIVLRHCCHTKTPRKPYQRFRGLLKCAYCLLLSLTSCTHKMQ